MIVAAVVGGVASGAAAEEELPVDPTMTGSAYALSMISGGALTPASVPGSPDTGNVESTAAGSYDAPCGVDLPPTAVTGKGLCANVTVGEQANTSIATASASSVTITLEGLPKITLNGVRAQSISQCSGSTGLGDVGEVRVDNQVIPVGVGPNFATDLAGQAGVTARLILNEQIQEGEQLTVNAARLIVTSGMGTSDLVIASATSGVRDCPAIAEPVAAEPAAQQPAPAAEPPVTVSPPSMSGLPGASGR
jgi:hypothetical protein